MGRPEERRSDRLFRKRKRTYPRTYPRTYQRTLRIFRQLNSHPRKRRANIIMLHSLGLLCSSLSFLPVFSSPCTILGFSKYLSEFQKMIEFYLLITSIFLF